MNRIQRMIACAGTATAVILALSGYPNLAQATEHTTGHQVGKLAVLAEFCGYGSRAQQIRSKYSNLPNFNEGYGYWRQHLGAFDFVHPKCGPVKDLADELISLNAQDLGAQQPQSVEKATPEDFDGKWIFEFTNKSATDRRIVEIKDNKFTTKVSANGWRGTVNGEINNYGTLVGQGKVSRLGSGGTKTPIDFTSRYRSGGFQEDVHVNPPSRAGADAAQTFRIKLTRDQTQQENVVVVTPGEEQQAAPAESSTEPTNYHKGLLAFDSGNYATAAHKWLISANHGDVTSQFRLAQLYEQGHGVPQDFVQAHRWYNIAASQGHAEARQARDALGNRMTANQLAEAQRLATETSFLLQFGLNQPAIPPVDQESAHAPRNISRFDGRWKAGAKLHYSSPKGRCGNQVVTIRILDGQVSGNIRLAVSFYKDSAAGAYPFSGTIDQEGNLQAKGHGLSLTGVISDEIYTIRGVWKLSSAGCRGTYDGKKEYGGQDL